MKKKVCIISFLGEFGYELLNWQGKFRRLHDNMLNSNERDQFYFIIGSRNGLNNFYENCDYFFELSNFDQYNNTIANNYTYEGNIDFNSFKEQIFLHLKENCSYIKNNNYELNEINFFWSHNQNSLNGVFFDHGTIYENCDHTINYFKKIEPDFTQIDSLSNELGFDITKEKYTYIQSGFRTIVTRSKQTIDFDYILEKISNINQKIVISNFFTNRYNDTLCRYGNTNQKIIDVSNFKKQSCLIHFANKNLFFSEGDFRSHNYVPPFMGKDVYSVAHQDVFSIGTTPIDFWNKNLFKFGGQIIPIKINERIESYNQIFDLYNEE